MLVISCFASKDSDLLLSSNCKVKQFFSVLQWFPHILLLPYIAVIHNFTFFNSFRPRLWWCWMQQFIFKTNFHSQLVIYFDKFILQIQGTLLLDERDLGWGQNRLFEHLADDWVDFRIVTCIDTVQVPDQLLVLRINVGKVARRAVRTTVWQRALRVIKALKSLLSKLFFAGEFVKNILQVVHFKFK